MRPQPPKYRRATAIWQPSSTSATSPTRSGRPKKRWRGFPGKKVRPRGRSTRRRPRSPNKSCKTQGPPYWLSARSGFAARRVILAHGEIDRRGDLRKMRPREWSLLDARGRRSPPAQNIEVPLAGFFDADTVAHGEIRQAPLFLRLGGALPGIGARDDRVVWRSQGSLSMRVRLPLLQGALDVLVRNYARVGVGGGRAVRLEPQSLHVRRGKLAPVIEHFLGVVAPGLLPGLRAGDDVVHEVEGKEVGLLVMAAGGHFPRGALRDHAAVEQRDRRELVRRHAVIDERLHHVEMRHGKVVEVERSRGDDPFPGTRLVPDEVGLGRLLRFAVRVDDKLRRFTRLFRPTLDDLRSICRHDCLQSWCGESQPRYDHGARERLHGILRILQPPGARAQQDCRSSKITEYPHRRQPRVKLSEPSDQASPRAG